jgi:general stress protein 26
MSKAGPEPKIHLWELIQNFRTAMLITRAPDGRLHGRPLSLASQHDGGKLYFSTSIDSPKVQEMAASPEVVVTLQDSRLYVSISGTAQISRDTALIERLWNEPWRVWFPGGKSDPSLSIVMVTPREAEYWDQTGAKGIKYFIEMIKAYATGTTPESAASSDNNKVKL